MKLSIEQNDYFDTMDELFMSKGWQLLMGDFEGFKQAMKDSLLGVQNIRDLQIAQGRIAEMEHILHYQEMIEAAKKSLEEAPEPVEEATAPI